MSPEHEDMDTPRDDAETEAHRRRFAGAEPVSDVSDVEAHSLRTRGPAEPADVEAHEAGAAAADDPDAEAPA